MATTGVGLHVAAAVLPDGTANNQPPALRTVKSSNSAPAPWWQELWFDAATEQWCTWALRMPPDYVDTPVLRVQVKYASATTGNAVWVAQVAAVSDGDPQDVDAKAFAAVNSVTVAVPNTVGYLDDVSIPLANDDSLAAGDLVFIRLARDADSGSDTATGNAEVVAVALVYDNA